jgi:hypothetical protein
MAYISVLLPTRQRVELVKHSLHNLVSTASNPADLEILIAYDDDDTQSQEFFSGPEWQQWIADAGVSARVFCVPPRGYKLLQEYYNYLAIQSQGQWLLLWNDDAVIETPNWDDHVRQNDSWRMLLHIPCRNLATNSSIFPLFHRDWIDLFGIVSPINHADSWISEVCWQARAKRNIDVVAFHDRADLTGNNRDETFLQRDYSAQVEYHSAEMVALRKQWADQLRTYLQNRQLSTPTGLA